MDAVCLDEVIVFEGEDCYDQFFEAFESTQHNCKCAMYNLPYEFNWIRPHISARYEYTRDRIPKKGEWNCLQDPFTIYQIKIKNSKKKMLTVFDDLKKLGGGISMKKAAEAIKKEFPQWFDKVPEEVKAETDVYNVWWTLPRFSYEYRQFLRYGKIDAFSQAMIMKYNWTITGNQKITDASFGLDIALKMKYKYSPRFNYDKFKQQYPPLDRDMQDKVEKSMVAGYVHGTTGTHYGIFTHLDYSSSYPYEYYAGNMFKHQVRRSEPTDFLLNDKKLFKWVLVSFDFDGLTECGMPAINNAECDPDEKYKGKGSLKRNCGRISEKLFTLTYFEELQKHYNIYNIELHEIWYAKAFKGDFADFIEYCYMNKSKPELKGTMKREHFKRLMNTGIHGKTITRTRRQVITWEDGIKHLESVINEPKYCALIGFTAMMNARERLLRHCRIIQEHGYRVMACDTDSMVVDAPPEKIREILGDAIGDPKLGIEGTLGKFEIETDKDGNETFDCFKSWGLKRYCEINNGKYRKSAFAGMHRDIQKEILIDAPTDGSVFSWSQKQKRQIKVADQVIGNEIYEGVKSAKAEEIFAEESDWKEKLARLQDEYWATVADKTKNEDMVAYLEDIRYDEVDPYWRRHVRKAYNEAIHSWESEKMDTGT